MALLACGRGDDGKPLDPAAGPGSPPVPSAAASAADPEVLRDGPTGPVRNRVIRLLLVNADSQAVQVLASAGAAEVPIDSLPPRDSSRVDLLVRADSARLRALGPGGRERARTVVRFAADSVRRWEVP